MVLYMNLGTTRLRGRPRNRWQDEVREDGRIFGGEDWQEKVHNREEWKNEWMDERMNIGCITVLYKKSLKFYPSYDKVMKKCITERNGRSSWEWQGIVAFCTWQWNEWMNERMNIGCITVLYKKYLNDPSYGKVMYSVQTQHTYINNQHYTPGNMFRFTEPSSGQFLKQSTFSNCTLWDPILFTHYSDIENHVKFYWSMYYWNVYRTALSIYLLIYLKLC